jgi:hypothetical protein
MNVYPSDTDLTDDSCGYKLTAAGWSVVSSKGDDK